MFNHKDLKSLSHFEQLNGFQTLERREFRTGSKPSYIELLNPLNR